MSAERRHVNIGFGDETVPLGTHMCFIYSDEAERRKVIGRFVESGLLSGEHVSYFAETASISDVKGWLKELGIKVPDDGSVEPLAVLEAEHTYCPHGHFDPVELFDGFRGFCHEKVAKQYAAIRMTGEMAWALHDIPGSDRLLEYEAEVNEFVLYHPIISICQYDANRFDGATLMRTLAVHPKMVVHGQIVHNPYYVKPTVFPKSGAAQRYA